MGIREINGLRHRYLSVQPVHSSRLCLRESSVLAIRVMCLSMMSVSVTRAATLLVRVIADPS